MKSQDVDRRRFLGGAAAGIAASGLSPAPRARAAGPPQDIGPGQPHFRPRARRVVWMFQSGGPSQQELFDPKPLLRQRHGEELPESVRGGQRLTGMSGYQSSLPLAGACTEFAQYGESGAWIGDPLPYTAGIVDKLCIVRSLQTDAINHDPAITLLQTGSQIAGRPSLGAWLSWALGSENRDLPATCVMITQNKGGQPLYSRLWGAGFLPSEHQGVLFHPGADPVLYLGNPPGVDADRRRTLLRTLGELHGMLPGEAGHAARSRTVQYELAERMQSSVPEAVDVSGEPDEVFELYGDASRTPGTYAANCLLARRLLERDVRCVQLFHQGWDQHTFLPGGLRTQCRETDQASAALVLDLERRGLLEDTLVIWGGEFGRTSYCQGRLTPKEFGRDHHPLCGSFWMAGAGVRPGLVHGETDEFGYNVVRDPVHVHDLQALILHQLGFDHERLTFEHQGRQFRLTDVHGHVPVDLLA